MKSLGYPKEYRGDLPWSDRPMRIVNGKFFWGEEGGWWWSDDGDEFMEKKRENDPRHDCPWKCPIGDPECLCARAGGQSTQVRE